MTKTGVHVAIVMDGNGRWATNRSMPRAVGHVKGARTAEKIIQAAPDIGIETITLYAFSTENWKRPWSEVETLFKLFERTLGRKAERMNREGVQIKCIGRRDRLPQSMLNVLESAEKLTENNTRLKLRICVDYGGHDEIVRIAREFANQVAQGTAHPDSIDETQFVALSDLADVPSPDLIIRTGGEMRLSNFLLWHAAYSELHFDDCLWPDYTPEKLAKAISGLDLRNRRYGGLVAAN